MLTACSSSTLSFSEITTVPSDVQKRTHSEYTLQLIQEEEHAYYIIFNSEGTVSAHIEEKGDTIQVKFKETNKQEDVFERHVYKLTKDPEHEVIDVYINGESATLDNFTDL